MILNILYFKHFSNIFIFLFLSFYYIINSIIVIFFFLFFLLFLQVLDNTNIFIKKNNGIGRKKNGVNQMFIIESDQCITTLNSIIFVHILSPLFFLCTSCYSSSLISPVSIIDVDVESKATCIEPLTHNHERSCFTSLVSRGK